MDNWKGLPCLGSGHELIARIKFKADRDQSYEFTISDLNCVWTEMITAEETKRRCKELNPRLEAPLSSIVEHIQKTLNAQCSESIYVDFKPSGHATINVKNQFAGGIPFKWEFKCKKYDGGFQDVFLSPMAKLAASLQLANARLIDIIRKKDNEIKDYKEFSGVKVSRPYLETEEFDEGNFVDGLRRSNEYKRLITGDVVSVLTSPSVNASLSRVESDFINPLPSLPSGSRNVGRNAKMRSHMKNRRPRNKRGPAKGVEAVSDSESGSNDESSKIKSISKKPIVAPKAPQKKKKVADKRKKLF